MSASAMPGCALVLLMALHADFRSLGRRQLFEAQDRAGLFAACGQVLAGWSVALFAGLPAVHVVLKRLGVRLVAGHAERVVVDVLGVRDLGQGDLQRRQLDRLKRCRPRRYAASTATAGPPFRAERTGWSAGKRCKQTGNIPPTAGEIVNQASIFDGFFVEDAQQPPCLAVASMFDGCG